MITGSHFFEAIVDLTIRSARVDFTFSVIIAAVLLIPDLRRKGLE